MPGQQDAAPSRLPSVALHGTQVASVVAAVAFEYVFAEQRKQPSTDVVPLMPLYRPCGQGRLSPPVQYQPGGHGRDVLLVLPVGHS